MSTRVEQSDSSSSKDSVMGNQASQSDSVCALSREEYTETCVMPGMTRPVVFMNLDERDGPVTFSRWLEIETVQRYGQKGKTKNRRNQWKRNDVY